VQRFSEKVMLEARIQSAMAIQPEAICSRNSVTSCGEK
jgi:hypothetical protein